MDAIYAIAFALAGFVDTRLNYCPDTCLRESAPSGEFSVSYGRVLFRDVDVGSEIYLRYALPRQYGPFQPVVGASLTSTDDFWVGAGAMLTYPMLQERAYVQLHLMPGLYRQGTGPDLGHVVEFRSGIELGWRFENGMRLGLSYDHRSNAEISARNPGMDTYALRLSVPLN